MARESVIETYFKDQVKAHGGETRKVQWIGRNSAPDDLALMSGWSFFAEIKRDDRPGRFPRDAHEAAQAREHARMRQAGITVFVLESKADVDAAMLP